MHARMIYYLYEQITTCLLACSFAHHRIIVDRPMSARKTGREIVSPPQQQQRAVGSGIGVRRGITSVNDSSDDEEALARRLAAEESPAVDVRMTPSGRPMTSRSRRQVTEDAGVARQLQLEDELAAQRQRSVGGRRVDMTPSPNPSSMDGDGGRPAGPPPQQFDSHSDPPR